MIYSLLPITSRYGAMVQRETETHYIFDYRCKSGRYIDFIEKKPQSRSCMVSRCKTKS